MDLEKLDVVRGSNAGFELQLYHPATRANLGIFFTILGRDSEEYRRVLGEQNRQRMSKAARAGGAYRPLSLEEIEQDTLEILVACTRAWKDVGEKLPDSIKVAGKVLACTPENTRKVYLEHPWIREQVDSAIADRANFLKP